MAEENTNQSWFFRFIKGMFVGSGFIIPGVSGGALAAIFGLYEPLIHFLASITHKFKENFMFFLPVGLGGFFGVFLLSFVVSFALENYATIVLWFFVGAIVGMIPSLWKDAGQEGRGKQDLGIMIVSFIAGLVILGFGSVLFGGQVEPGFWAFVLCGIFIALGALIPGLSPSNFIVYMGLYTAMADGFKNFDLSVLVPLGIGAVLTVFALAKVIEKIFERFYSQFFHFIFGIVVASTIMIIPLDYTGFGLIEYIWCVAMLVLGIGLGYWMSQLEEEYK